MISKTLKTKRPARQTRSGVAGGQALLPLLIVIVIVLSLGTAVIELAIGNILVDRYFQEAIFGFYTAEAALENGLLRLLRNPAYAGESLQINDVPCTIETVGTSPVVMTATCNDTHQVRKVRAEINYVDGVMVVNHLGEVE
jgi:Tfp pilus assembly protein PilX